MKPNRAAVLLVILAVGLVLSPLTAGSREVYALELEGAEVQDLQLLDGSNTRSAGGAVLRQASQEPGDRFFEDLTENSNHTEDGLVFVDSWGTEDLAGVGTEFLLELYISKYDSDRNLSITGYYWDDESGIESVKNFTDPFHILSGCLNASIWCDKFGTDDWVIAVSGTFTSPAGPSGFVVILLYDGTTFTELAREDGGGDGLRGNGEDTYFVDMTIFDYENDSLDEIVVSGYRFNTATGLYIGTIWIYDCTGVALSIDHVLTWSDSAVSIKVTAHMHGLLCAVDSLWELVVVGFETNTTGAVRARQDVFFGSETPWESPNETFAFSFVDDPVDSLFHDIAIGGYDGGSGGNQSLAVGRHGGLGLVIGVNYTSDAVTIDFFTGLAYDGHFTVFCEVEIADRRVDPPQTESWPSQEVVIAGRIKTGGGIEKLLVQVWNMSDNTILWNYTSSEYFVQVFNWMEIMLTDWTGDNEPEITLGWTLENSIMLLETVFDIGLGTVPSVAVPGTGPEPEVTEETGRKKPEPRPTKKDDVVPWVFATEQDWLLACVALLTVVTVLLFLLYGRAGLLWGLAVMFAFSASWMLVSLRWGDLMQLLVGEINDFTVQFGWYVFWQGVIGVSTAVGMASTRVRSRKRQKASTKEGLWKLRAKIGLGGLAVAGATIGAWIFMSWATQGFLTSLIQNQNQITAIVRTFVGDIWARTRRFLW